MVETPAASELPPLPPGPLLRELQQVHNMLRRDLEVCRDLADAGRAGASPADVARQVGDLRTRGMLFQLRSNCLSYCQLVHFHHTGEDTSLFPAVERQRPDLANALRRLDDDHRAVSALLDQIAAAAEDPPDTEETARGWIVPLIASLEQVADQLEAHFDLEERTLAPVLATWRRWPSRA